LEFKWNVYSVGIPWNLVGISMDSNGNCSGRLPDSDHSASFRRIPSECPWNWKLEWLRLQPTEFWQNLADSDIPLGIHRIPPELMGECKVLGFLAFSPLFIDAVLGYRRPAACNTELRVLLIVIYNVGYCF
jgi:hypothetical protein